MTAPTKLGEIVGGLLDTLGETDLGIAAPQIGEPFRVVLAKIPSLTVAVNPSWTRCGPLRPGAERCLSVSSATASRRVFRHIAIDAEWMSVDGTKKGARLTGRDAVVFQHEVDHLDGITINRK